MSKRALSRREARLLLTFIGGLRVLLVYIPITAWFRYGRTDGIITLAILSVCWILFEAFFVRDVRRSLPQNSPPDLPT
jgi:hypothetical protein